jgi:hypothetical protein
MVSRTITGVPQKGDPVWHQARGREGEGKNANGKVLYLRREEGSITEVVCLFYDSPKAKWDTIDYCEIQHSFDPSIAGGTWMLYDTYKG